MNATFKHLALCGTLIALVGCAAKPQEQKVMVSPTGFAPVAADTTNTPYTGESLINNSPEIVQAAASLPNVVHFAFNSDAIDETAAKILDQQIGFLTANQNAKVLIAGHTDERGSREYNLSLGERRAVAVRQYLASKGVNAEAVQVVSYGEERPVAQGNDEASWSQNRRAEFIY